VLGSAAASRPSTLTAAPGAETLHRSQRNSAAGLPRPSAPALVLLGLGLGCAVVSPFSLGPGRHPAGRYRVAAALVNTSNQVGGSLGAALLNSIAANATASYLAQHPADPSMTAATVHGDIVSFTFLVTLFGAGVIPALLYPRRERITTRLTTPAGPAPAALQPERRTSVAADQDGRQDPPSFLCRARPRRKCAIVAFDEHRTSASACGSRYQEHGRQPRRVGDRIT
jgi:hypothetical protein